MTIRSGIALCGLSLAISIRFAAADNYNVINTTDSGAGSLRQAILDANAHANAGAPDTISFAIPGGGLQTITPLTPLPTIADPVVIDGYTQPGSSPNTLAVGDNSVHLIELNGNGANFRALDITAGNSTVRGLVINRFNGNGPANAINLLTAGGNKIEGCFIGLSADGTTAQSNNGLAIYIESSPNNTIGGTTPAARNVVSSNHGASGANILIVGASSSGTTIQGNYIGTNAAGTADTGGNVNGVQIGRGSGDGSSNNIIGGTTTAARNVISGNAGGGVVLFDDTIMGNRIQGNYIGTNAAGTAAVPNFTGVDLDSTNNTTIGGTVAGAGNLISGNGNGINLGGNGLANNNLVQGNLIGTNAAGTAGVGNNGGIILMGSNNTIGGTTPGARNIISGSLVGHGIRFLLSATTVGNLIQGNYIGTDINGTSALGNAADGIQIFAFQPPTGVNTIGGASAAARNLISANGAFGIEINGGTNIVIQGNYIGTDVNGTADLGNGFNGVPISSGSNNSIGGTAPGAGNTIAFNGKLAPGTDNRNGVAVFSGTGNAIQGNSIFSNLRLGIDLVGGTQNASGVTANDPCDADTGPNNLQNYPVLTSVSSGGGMTSITGTLNSVANTTYRLEFFANNLVDPSGFGEGQSFIGATDVTTDANCNAPFSFSVPQIAGIQRVTATATDPNGNTSEFSAAIGQLLNVSTRLRVQTEDNVLIGGFILTGTEAKRVIVRGIGPSLSGTVEGFLADPTLELHDATGTLASNDNWRDTQQAEIEATGIAPSNDLEAAIVRTVPANNSAYTVIVRGKDNTTGIGVVEAYDLDQAANSKLANISTRGFVETGNNVLIGGIIVGNGVTKVVVRAIGPTLANAGVASPLQDPTLELHDGTGATIASNDDWRTTQEAEIIATGIAPTDDRESAIVATLNPGPYTAIVRGAGNTTGVGLVEVYNIP